MLSAHNTLYYSCLHSLACQQECEIPAALVSSLVAKCKDNIKNA